MSHWSNIINSLEQMAGEVLPPPVEDALPPIEHQPWTLWRSAARVLARAVLEHEPESVLEFGAGRSSLVIATALSTAGGGRITSIDQSPEHSAEMWSKVHAVPRVDARLLTAKLRSSFGANGLIYQYQGLAPDLGERGPFDLVFIDGPPFFYGRDGTLHLAFPHLSPGALIIMDDARRGSERRIIARWLRRYPELHLEALDPDFGGDEGHGIAILTHGLRGQSRTSLRNIAGASLEWLWTWRHIRWKLRTAMGST